MTFEQFEAFWTPETWQKRGLGSQDLVMGRLDPRQGWHRDNIEIRTCYSNQKYYQDWKDRLGLPRWYRFLGDEHRLKEIPPERLIKNKKKKEQQ